MTIQQDVQDLKARLAALEHRLTGDRIHLRAGGTSLIIHPGGIDIETARLNITAGQSVQITAGSALALTAGNQCAITAGGRLEITAGSQYVVSAGSGVQIDSGNDLRLTARSQLQATATQARDAPHGECEAPGDIGPRSILPWIAPWAAGSFLPLPYSPR